MVHRTRLGFRRTLFSFLTVWLSLFGVGGAAAQSQFPAGSASVGTGGDPNNGDRDGTVVLFFEIPATAPSPIYFAINDPGITGTAALLDLAGTGNSYWYLLGGGGALSDSSSQLITYNPYPSTQPLAGTLLWTQTWASGAGTGWNYTPAVALSSGEHIGNKYYFKLVLQVDPGTTGKNAFQADVSSTTGSITSVAGAKSFAFDWSPMLSTNAATGPVFDFYPFVPNAATGNLTAHNWDIDNTGMAANVFKDNSGAALAPAAVAIGGPSTEGTTSYAIGTKTNGSWHLNLQANNTGGTSDDLAEIWFTDGSTVLRTYSSAVAAQTADHITATYNGGTLPVGGTGTVTLQAVDASGNPQLYVSKVWVTTSGSATITASSATSTALPANGALVTTDGNGLATITVTDSVAEAVTVQPFSDGTGGSDVLTTPASDNTVGLTFSATSPTLTSTSTTNITVAGNTALPSITLNANGGAVLAATNLYLRTPSSLNTTFNTGSAPTVSSTPGGLVSGASFVNSSTLKLTLAGNFTGPDTITISAGLQLAVAANVVSSGSLQLSYDGGSSYPVTDSVGNPAITINTAGTYTWKTAATTVNWSTAANWVGGVVPPAGSAVVIPSGITGSQPTVDTAVASISSLTVNSGSTLTTGTFGLTVSGATTLNGTIAGGSGALTFGGSVSGTGSLTASSGTTYVAGALTAAGFTANGGSLIVNGTGAQTLNGYNFNNVEVNKMSGTTVSAGGNWTVGGAFTLTKGTFSNGTNTLTVTGPYAQSGGTFGEGTGTVAFNGTTNTFAGALTKNASGLIAFSGGTTQTLTATGQDLGNVAISGASTILSVGNQTVTFDNLTVSGELDLNATSGSVKLQLNSGKTLTNSGTVKVLGTSTNAATLAAASGTASFTGNDVSWTSGQTLTLSSILYAPSLNLLATTATVKLGDGNDTFTNVTVGSGTFNSNAQNWSVSGNWDNSSTGTLGGATGTATFTGATKTIDSGGTGTSPNKVFGPVVVNGTYSLTGTAVSMGSLGGTGTLVTNSLAMAVSGNVTIANLTASGSETISVGGNFQPATAFTCATSLVTLTGTATLTPAGNFYDLSVTGTATLGGNLTTTRDLGIGASGGLSAGVNTITVGRNWSNADGTSGFTAGTSTVQFDVTQTSHTLSGSTTFYNLTTDASAAAAQVTVNFPAYPAASQTIAASGSLTLKGKSGQLLVLTGGSNWGVNFQGAAQTVQFVQASFANAVSANITAGSSSNFASNNLAGTGNNWVFAATTLTWTGAANSSWNTATNWDLGYVPNPTDNAVLTNAGTALDIAGLSANIANLTVNASGVVNATASGTITLSGNLIVNTPATFGTPANVNWTMTGSGATVNSALATTVGNVTVQPGAGNTVSLATNPLTVSNLTIGNGTFSAGTLNLTVTGNLTGTGTYSGSSGTTSVAGNWNVSNFTASGGTVTFNGTGAQTVTPNAQSFANVTVDNTFGTAPQVTAAGAMTLTGNLVLTAGTLLLPNQTQTIGGNVGGAGTLDASTIAGANTLTVSGSMGTAGTPLANLSAPSATALNVGTNWNVTAFTANTGTVAFTGTGTISSATTFYNLSKTTGGATTASAGLVVSNNLTLTAGTLAMGANQLEADGPIGRTAGAMTFGAGGNLLFKGTAAQTANLTGSTLQDMTVQNSAATPTVTLTNTAGFAWNGNANLTAGTLVLANQTQTIGGNVSGVGVLNASTITGANTLTVGGYMGTAGTPLANLSAPTSTTLNVGTDWNVTAFTVNTGTVAFTGTGTISSAPTFYNLSKTTGGTTTFGAGIGLSVNNNLVVSAGTLVLANVTGSVTGNVSGAGALNASAIAGANSLTVGGYVGTSGTVLANLTAPAGTLFVDGDFDVTTFTHNGGTVDFSTQVSGATLTTGGTGVGKNFNNVVLSGSGTLSLSGSLGLSGYLNQSGTGGFNFSNQSVLVEGALTLTSVTASGSTIYLVPTAASTAISCSSSLNNVVVNANGGSIQQSTNLTVHRFMAFKGNWNANGHNLTTTEDFVVYGARYATYSVNSVNYNPSDDGELAATRLPAYYQDLLGYPYFGTNGPSVATMHTALVTAFGLTLNDGTRTSIPAADLQTATITTTSGALNVGRNFYDFGASITATGALNLNLPGKWASGTSAYDPSVTWTGVRLNQSKSTDWFGLPFAVAIATAGGMNITNCSASQTVAAAQTFVGASANPSPSASADTAGVTSLVSLSGTTNWDNVIPVLTSATTRFDNLVELKFSKNILNSSGEANFAAGSGTSFDDVRFDNFSSQIRAGAAFQFTVGTPGSVGNDYTVVSLPNGNVSTSGSIAFQASGLTWNTDATGTSLGGATSTNRSGAHQTLVPNVAIEKGRLYDSSGNPIINHDGQNYNGAFPSWVYTATIPKARPVLVKVLVGQQTYGAGSSADDSHNFFHLEWSHPVNLAGTGISNIDNVGLPTNLPAGATFGDSYGAGPVTVQGLFSYNGTLDRSTRTYGEAHLGADPTSDGINYPGLVSNSLFRYSATFQDLVISVAGYRSSGTGTSSYWDGFIWNVTQPVGQVFTALNDGNVVDANGNQMEDSAVQYPSALTDPKASFSIQQEGSGIAGLSAYPGRGNPAATPWEVDPPQFAPYETSPSSGPYTVFEIIPHDSGAGIVDQFQFHILANSKNSVITNTYNSQSSWNSTTNNPDTQILDFGLRDTSLVLADAKNGFAFQALGDSSFISPITSTNSSVENTLFTPPMLTPTNTTDDGYFSLVVSSVPASWKPTSTFNVTYDQFKGMLTDLAGLLLPSQNMKTIDQTPPYIVLTLAAQGATRVYVQFSRQVKALIAQPLVLSGASGNSISSFTPVSGSIGSGFQEAYVDLTQPLAADDVWKATLSCAPSQIIGGGNTMVSSIFYPITSLAIDMVQPVWASDGTGGEVNQSGTAHVIHDFVSGAEDLASNDIDLQAKIYGTTGPTLPLRLFYDHPTPSTPVTNKVWLPSGLFNLTATDGVQFQVLPSSGDSSTRFVDPYAASSTGSLKNFRLPGSDGDIQAGNSLQFLFRLGSLYVVHALSPDTDPRQLTLWQIPFRQIKLQKNGVTVLNNVIDPTKGQQTEILYTMKKSGIATIQVFDLGGNLVRVLHRGRQASGDYTLYWDGTNTGGRVVARGVYFVRVVAPDTDEIRDILIIK